jgi:hypothetical protein
MVQVQYYCEPYRHLSGLIVAAHRVISDAHNFSDVPLQRLSHSFIHLEHRLMYPVDSYYYLACLYYLHLLVRAAHVLIYYLF